MKLLLKKWYIKATTNCSWEELVDCNYIFDRFEIISWGDTNKQRVGYLNAYTEKAVKVAYVDYLGIVKTKYVPLAALVVVDDTNVLAEQFDDYNVMCKKENNDLCIKVVKDALRTAPTWANGYILNTRQYV